MLWRMDMERSYLFRIRLPDGHETIAGGGPFETKAELERHALELSHANRGACVEAFCEQDPKDVVRLRVGGQRRSR
jgi:hypothetical protein